MTERQHLLPRRAVLSLALAAGSALTLLGGAKANAQNSNPGGLDTGSLILLHNSNGSGTSNPAPTTDSAIRYLKELDAEAAAQNAKKSPPVDPYVTKAKAIFAIDSNGNYAGARTPRFQSIVDNVIKLYNQAGPKFEHTPGLYAPMRQYFNSLKTGQEQDVALMVVNELTPNTLSDHNTFPVTSASLKGIVGDYGVYLKQAGADGYSTIGERFKSSVLRKPPTNSTTAGIEAIKVTFASMLAVPYSPRSLRLVASSTPNSQ